MQAERVGERREHHPAQPCHAACLADPAVLRGAAPGAGAGTALALTSPRAFASSATLRGSVLSFMLPPLAGEPRG